MAARYVRGAAWAKQKNLPSGYSMYSGEKGTYCNEHIRVVKPFIHRMCDPPVFWHVFFVSVETSVCNSMRSEATWGIKRT